MLLETKNAITQFETRLDSLLAFSEAHNDPTFSTAFAESYLEDTAFAYSNIVSREISAPQELIRTLAFGTSNSALQIHGRTPVGRVAILLPKNGIGITAAKSVASSYLMGNDTIVKIPSQLQRSSRMYSDFVTKHLPGVSFASNEMSSKKFLEQALLDPTVHTVVIYGDDAWIDGYLNLARRTRTRIIFEGPGNDPAVIFPGMDLKKAVAECIACGLLNGGQSCSALERYFVHEEIHDTFVTLLCEGLQRVKIGSPLDSDVVVGPTLSGKIVTRIEDQLKEATRLGAEIKLGGRIVRDGYKKLPIVLPTVITGCTSGMSVVKHETFGPVFPIVRFGADVDEVIASLDDTAYGLNASVYGAYDQKIFEYLLSSHRNLFVNSTFACRQNHSSRFADGGYKNSGFIWEWQGNHFIRKEGRRLLVEELSLPTSES